MTNDLAVTPSDPGCHLPPSPDLLPPAPEPIRSPHPDWVTNEKPAAACSRLSTILAPCHLFISQTPGPWAWGTLNWKPSENCICLVSVILARYRTKSMYCKKSWGLVCLSVCFGLNSLKGHLNREHLAMQFLQLFGISLNILRGSIFE